MCTEKSWQEKRVKLLHKATISHHEIVEYNNIIKPLFLKTRQIVGLQKKIILQYKNCYKCWEIGLILVTMLCLWNGRLFYYLDAILENVGKNTYIVYYIVFTGSSKYWIIITYNSGHTESQWNIYSHISDFCMDLANGDEKATSDRKHRQKIDHILQSRQHCLILLIQHNYRYT